MRPSPQQWLRENPGKNLHDYFLAFPETKPQSVPSPYNQSLSPVERRALRLKLFCFVSVLVVGGAGLWYAPRQASPYLVAGLGVAVYLIVKKEAMMGGIFSKSQASESLLAAIRLAILPLLVGALFKLMFMLSFAKTMVVLFNGSNTAQTLVFDKEQKTLQPNEIWEIECRDGSHRLLNPATNQIEGVDLQPGFHAFSYGTDTKLSVAEIEYKSSDELTESEKIEKEVFGGLLSYRPKYPVRVSGHYSVLHEMRNHVYLPDERVWESVAHQKGTAHKYFKLDIQR